jgi:4-amino-4-deoxychorismate lyase
MGLTQPLILINGKFNGSVSAQDRGFTYGDGVYETCRYANGKIPLWSFHLERLLAGVKHLAIPIEQQILEDYLNTLLNQFNNNQPSAQPNAIVKIIITRGEGGRGYKIPEAASPTYCLSLFPTDELCGETYLNGCDVRICQFRLSRNKTLAGLKHLNRLEQIMARMEWQDEVDEGLLLDENNNLIEATAANLFLVKNNTLLTPDLSYAGVAGVMRRVIIEKIAPQSTISVVIKNLTLDALASADEVFLCNSVRGIKPVNRVVGLKDFSTVSKPLTRQLQTALEKTFFSELYFRK